MSNSYEMNQTGLIKTLFAQPEQITAVADIITSEDIEEPRLKAIYQAMLDLSLANEEISGPSVALEIQKGGSAIDPAFLLGLEENTVDFVAQGSPEQWAILTKQEAARVKAMRLSAEAIELFKNPENIPIDSLHDITASFEELAKDSAIRQKRTIKEIAEEVAAKNKELQAGGISEHYVLSPYPSIDYYTGGWGPAQMITVGARTGVGKSVFAANCAVAAMEADESVLFFSFEMNENEILARMIASLAHINISKVEKGYKLNEKEQADYDEAIEFIGNSKLTLETEADWNIESVKARAVEVAQSELGLDLIIIDYLQLLSTARRGNRNRQEEVAEISRNIKKMAQELNVPVIVLVQLNHRVEDINQLPTKAEIRESGAIANDSNVIILIHRDTYEGGETPIDPKAKFIIDKNRQGREGVYIDVRAMMEYGLFVDERERVIPDDFNPHKQEVDLSDDPLNDDFGDFTPNDGSLSLDDDTDLSTDFDDDMGGFFGDDGSDPFGDDSSDPFGDGEYDEFDSFLDDLGDE